MTFNDILCRKYPDKVLIKNENKTVFYKDLFQVQSISANKKEVFKIIENDNISQLKILYTLPQSFIPFVTPENLINENIKNIYDSADFVVATSGTTNGKSKYYFRNLRTWSDFYPIQNKIFNINQDTKIFVQGSMCYTGNLNTVSGALFAGTSIVTSTSIKSKFWAKQIKENLCNHIYLVPKKLVYLCKCGEVFNNVNTILCGSQLILKNNFNDIKNTFPNARIILYYGSSEASYISYKIIENKITDETCVGKPFKNIKVSIGKDRHIFVDSNYLVCGVSNPFDTGDRGHIDKSGNIYFEGRDKNIL